MAAEVKRDFSAEERRKLAKEGKALPDGSYPIADAEDLKNAAILAQSGHGDVAAAKRLIARRAKELGVANPLKKGNAPKHAATEVGTPATDVDHTTELPDADADIDGIENPDVAKSNPIADAIAAHNAGTPTPNMPGRHLLDASRDGVPLNPRGGNAAPTSPALDAIRDRCSQSANSSSPTRLAGRPGPNRAETRNPGPGVAESATKAMRDGATGAFTHPAGVPGGVVHLDLAANPGTDAAAHFRRPNDRLPHRAANSPATQPPNTSRNER